MLLQLSRTFIRRHEKIEYVYWMIAESNFRLIPDTVDRDLTMAKKQSLLIEN